MTTMTMTLTVSLPAPAPFLVATMTADPAALPDFEQFPTWDEIAAQVAQEELEAAREEREAAMDAVRQEVATAAEPITGTFPIVQSPLPRDQHIGAVEAVLERVRDIVTEVRRTRRVTDLETALHAIDGVL